MKFPLIFSALIFSALILMAGAALGWKDQQRIKTLKAERQTLLTEAASLGLSIDTSNPESGPRLTKRARENRDEVLRQLTAEIIAFAKQIQQVEERNGEPDEEQQRQGMALIAKLFELSPSQIRAFIGELKATDELNNEMKRGMILMSIMALAESSPTTALALLTESSGTNDDGFELQFALQSALTKLAQENPMEAVQWIKNNQEKHPDLIDESIKNSIISGAAHHDPKLAFQLLDELGSSSIHGIMQAVTTPEARIAAIEALREHLSGMDDAKKINELREKFFEGFTLRNQNFEQTIGWLSEVHLSPEEATAFAQNLSYHQTKQDSGKWIDWIAQNLPPDKAGDQIKNIIRNWTREDFQSAGTWLAQAPDDATKIPAIQSYAETIAEYEPATAEQWALTLPEGKNRDNTLNSIHRRWPENDPEGKSAFAEKHGIDR